MDNTEITLNLEEIRASTYGCLYPNEAAPGISPFIAAETATDAWDILYRELSRQAEAGFVQPSRAGNVVGELINATVVIQNPRKGIVLSPKRAMSMEYATGELLWYLSGSNKLKDIAPHSKAWSRLTDDGETVNSAYGHRIFHQFGFNQLDYVMTKLIENPFDRQAVIHIKDPSNKPSKDTPCTLTLQFNLRNDKLYLLTNMRSNDIWLGFPYDVFSFTSLQQLIAMQLHVDVGTYTHVAGSLHLYERDWKKHGKE